jgi:hypothetical protein
VSVIRAMRYAHLKRLSVSTRLHSHIYQKDVTYYFIIYSVFNDDFPVTQNRIKG